MSDHFATTTRTSHAVSYYRPFRFDSGRADDLRYGVRFALLSRQGRVKCLAMFSTGHGVTAALEIWRDVYFRKEDET